MRRLAAAVAAVVLLAISGCDGGVPAPSKSNVVVDTPELRAQKAEAGIEPCVPGTGRNDLPSLTLACLGGGPAVDLSTLQGPMLLNVWYSGCGPCRDEMPILQRFHEQYAAQVPLVGIDIETYPDYALDFADEVGATYPQLADPGGTLFDDADLALAKAFPQTIFVGADGQLVKVPKEITSLEELVDMVETNLGVTL